MGLSSFESYITIAFLLSPQRTPDPTNYMSGEEKGDMRPQNQRLSSNWVHLGGSCLF